MVPGSIERDILIDAPVEVVWSIVTEPEHVGRWLSDSVEIDLRPGGERSSRGRSSDHPARRLSVSTRRICSRSAG
jgi:uncharacterized protein YndB with AHSA1/START domain